jgi:pyrroloquinoline quinone biosynthesis protein E
MIAPAEKARANGRPAAERPMSLLAELTYRCVLQCPYCSNPLRYAESRYREELTTEDWQRVLSEARQLGVIQLALSGGEPTLRRDLLPIVETAVRLGLYSTLVTAGTLLPDEKLAACKDAGLDHVQISLQGATSEVSDLIAGTESFAEKVAAMRRVVAHGFPLTVNVVLHRLNLHQVGDFIRIAEEVGADKIELANTQYHGWALLNRKLLMPTREQVEESHEVVRRERERIGAKLQIVYVIPDYFEEFPKPCLDGWARRFLTVTPNGDVLPCQAAGDIKSLAFENVRDRPLEWIWYESPSFNVFRGFDWMPEPCRSCPAGRQHVDFGGCRCQAFALTGDASRTDPVCKFSSDHWIVEKAVVEAEAAVERVAGATASAGRAIPVSLPVLSGGGEAEPTADVPAGVRESRVPAAAESSGAADAETGLVFRTPKSMRKVLEVVKK